VVDPGGMTFWTNELIQGVPPANVILNIERCSTNEFQRDEVEYLYERCCIGLPTRRV